MRWLGMIFASLTMLCLFCAPALAQSAPSTCQYQPCPSSAETQSLNDGADAFSENAGQGTDAVNEALEEPEASASASGVPPGVVGAAASATAEPSSAGGGTSEEGETEGPAQITRLPETGGAPLATLGAGMLLTTFGLMALRSAGR